MATDLLLSAAPAATYTSHAGAAPPLTVAAALEAFLRDGRVRGLADATIRAYRADLKSLPAFSEAAGASELASITRELLRDWTETTAGRVSRARRVSTVRLMLEHFRLRDVLDANPADGLPRLTRPAPIPHAITPEQALRLVKAGGSARDRAIVTLLYGTGVRCAELCGLDVAHVDLDQGWARVIGKGDKQRDVPLLDPVVDALRRWLRKRGRKPGALFTGRRGTRLATRSVARIVGDRAAKIGLPGVHPHTLRHACASQLLDAGADLRVIQQLLGHTNLNTTTIYARSAPRALATIYNHAQGSKPCNA